jgi:SAM-dependent methyltransferase
MATATQPQQPTPERIFNTLHAFHQTEGLKTAIELEVFTAIAEGNTTPATIATRCNASERGVRTLCDFLTVHGFLTKSGAQYGLSPDAALFLVRSSPAYLGGAVEFLLAPKMRESMVRLTEAVKRGGTALGEGNTETDNPEWVKFATGMMPLMFMPAQMMTAELRKGGEAHKVLDIAAGHGLFGIMVAKANPAAQIYACDWKAVLEVAKKNAQGMGVGDRHHLLPGSAFDVDFGNGYDLALVTNFLHHFDVPTCTAFMKKVHASLAPGGRAAILEFVPNADRVSPPSPATFSMIMLSTTPAGDAYTYAELEKMCKDAGFSRVEGPQSMGMDSLIVAYK